VCERERMCVCARARVCVRVCACVWESLSTFFGFLMS